MTMMSTMKMMPLVALLIASIIASINGMTIDINNIAAPNHAIEEDRSARANMMGLKWVSSFAPASLDDESSLDSSSTDSALLELSSMDTVTDLVSHESVSHAPEDLRQGNPITAEQLLPVRAVVGAGLPNTFAVHDLSSEINASADSDELTDQRMAHAKSFLKIVAHSEHEAAHNAYKKEQSRRAYLDRLVASRQSKAFQRPLPGSSAYKPPHPSLRRAEMNGDRTFNVMFPAATARSDGKENSQVHDFQHAGAGDQYAQQLPTPAVLIELQNAHASDEETTTTTTTVVTDDSSKSSESSESSSTEGAAAGADGAAAGGAAGETETTTKTSSSKSSKSSSSSGKGDKKGKKGDKDEKTPAAKVLNPLAAPEPCALQCEGPGLWRTAVCQDCIVRGMVNGWILKSIYDKQSGYNYAHFARNKCVAYANEVYRKSDVKSAPFSHCWFQKMHETCNL